MKKIDLTGKRFGRLIVISISEKKKSNHIHWICKCDCGNITHPSGNSLKAQLTKSCGCLNKETYLTFKHGLRNTDEYKIWLGIKQRCYNAKRKEYKNYGGIGILMCDSWKNNPVQFIKDVGIRPSKLHSLERVKNNLGYSKENCIWATVKEQNRNTRRTKKITWANKTQCLKDWESELFPFSYGIIGARLKAGWNLEKAMTTPKTH
jgi:hypothetical protein